MKTAWCLRCLKCENVRAIVPPRGLRLFAFSMGKLSLAYCRKCRRFRVAMVEKCAASDPHVST